MSFLRGPRRNGDTDGPGPAPQADVVNRALARLFGRDSGYMLLWGAQVVVAALVTPFMTRVLDVPSFGVVTAANAVMQVVFVLGGWGLYSAVQRQYSAFNDRRGPFQLLTFSIVAATATVSLFTVTRHWWLGATGLLEHESTALLALAWAGVSAVTNTALGLIRSQDRLLGFATVSLLQSVIAEVLSLGLVAMVRATPEMFLFGQLAAQVAALLLALVMVPPRRLGWADRALVGSALAFGLPLVPAVLSTFVLNTSDRLIVQSQLGPEFVARYQVAYNVGAMPMLLLGVLNSSWMPRIYSFTSRSERTAVIAASRNVLFLLVAPTCLGLAVMAPLVLRLWAPSEYRTEDLLLLNAVVLVSAFPYAAALSSTRCLLAEGRTRSIATAQGAAAAANIVLTFALLPAAGLLGAALATFLSMGLLSVLLSTRVRRLGLQVAVPRSLLAELLLTAGLVVAVGAVPGGSWWALRLCVLGLTVALFFRRLPVRPKRRVRTA